jgi:hypothetical protein
MNVEKNEAQQGQEIMQMVNEITPAKQARIQKEIERAAGATPFYLNVRQIMPLDLTAAFESELAAYKLAYAYREHWTSRVRIEKGAAVGTFVVVIQPK